MPLDHLRQERNFGEVESLPVVPSRPVAGFEDAVNRRIADQQRAARNTADQAVRAHQAIDYAADELDHRLREMAAYLQRYVRPTTTRTPKLTWSKPTIQTPQGFILERTPDEYVKRGTLVQMLVLTTDGRLWEWKASRRYDFSRDWNQKAKYIDIRETFNSSDKVRISSFAFYAGGGLRALSDYLAYEGSNPIDPTEALASIAARVVQSGHATPH